MLISSHRRLHSCAFESGNPDGEIGRSIDDMHGDKQEDCPVPGHLMDRPVSTHARCTLSKPSTLLFVAFAHGVQLPLLVLWCEHEEHSRSESTSRAGTATRVIVRLPIS